MGRRWSGILSILTLALVGAASGAAARDGAYLPTSDMQLGTAIRVRVDGSRIISMSPDGRSIVVTRPAGQPKPTEVCVLDLETLDERACADLSVLQAGLHIPDVTWSPDSRWLAFTERALEVFLDGDLWLMDAGTGELTNLLDDGFDGRLPILDRKPAVGAITIPVAPTFTPDGSGLTFSRSLILDGAMAGNDIATVPLEGGEPQRLWLVDPRMVGVAYAGMGWSPDGQRLYVSVSHPGGRDERDGIWVVEADGTDARQLVGSYQPGGSTPALLQVAPDGEHLLVYDPTLLGPGRPGVAVLATVAADDGSATPLQPLQSDTSDGPGIDWAGFSPDGGTLVTVRGSGRAPGSVSLRDVVGTGEHALELSLDGDDPTGLGPLTLGLGPTWSPEGRLFLTSSADASSGWLLSIDGSATAGQGGQPSS